MEKADPKMLPEASPWTARRINNGPVVIVCCIVGAFLSAIAFAIVSRANQGAAHDDSESPRQRSGSDASKLARAVVGDHKAGLIPAEAGRVNVAPVSAMDAGVTVPIVTVHASDTPPLPPRDVADQGAEATSAADEERKERLAALRRSLRTSTSVQFEKNREGASEDMNVQEVLADKIDRVRRERERLSAINPSAGYEQAIRSVQGTGSAAPSEDVAAATASSLGATTGGAAPALTARGENGGNDRFRLDSELHEATSAFVVQAGAVIPATLLSAVNSELPGPIVAQVAQPVYDTATGRHLLIPQGAKLYGEYSSNVAYGQSRLLIAWQRIAMGSKTIDIGAMPGVDGVGRAGFEDEVNNHFFRLFASALLMSGVTAGISMSQQSGRSADRMTAGSALSEAVGQQLGQVTARMIEKNMNIAPTLEIRPGYRFNIVATKDIEFPGTYRRHP